jgi:small GTP-binding protein
LDGKPSIKNTIPTVGFNNINKTVQLSDGSLINCYLLDTAGQERFEALNSQYYKRADAVLLVYDITNKKSFDKLKEYYVDQIKNNCKEDIIIELLGNKSDLENQRQVSIDEGINLAMEHNYEFLESSCLQNTNVTDAFLSLIERWNFKNHKSNRRKSLELKRSLTETPRNHKSNNNSDKKSIDTQKPENIVLGKHHKKKSHKKKCC